MNSGARTHLGLHHADSADGVPNHRTKPSVLSTQRAEPLLLHLFIDVFLGNVQWFLLRH